MRRVLFILTLLSLFLISWILPRALSEKFCINSSLVENVISYEKGEEKIIYHSKVASCSIKTLLAAERRGEHFKEVRKIIKRLEGLEKFSALFKPANKRKIFISSSEPFIYKIVKEHIIIGLEIVKSQPHLELAILESLVSEHLKTSEKNNGELFSEIIARSIYGLYGNYQEITSITDGYKYKIGQEKIYSALKMKMNYCESPSFSSRHYIDCINQNALVNITKKQMLDLLKPEIWSLRDFMAGMISAYYNKLSLKEKNKALKNLASNLQRNYWDSQYLLSANIANIEKTELFLDLFIPSLIIDFFGGEKFELDVALLDQVMDEKAIGTVPSFKTKFHHMSDVKLSSGAFRSLEKAKVLEEGDFIVSSSGGYTRLSDYSLVPSWFHFRYGFRNEVILGCEVPTPSKILSLKLQKQKIVFIKFCDFNNLNLVEMNKQGVDSYLKNNKQVEYIEFHIPSLRLAYKIYGEYKGIDVNFNKQKTWASYLGWESVDDDETQKVSKPSSVVDAIVNFRLAN